MTPLVEAKADTVLLEKIQDRVLWLATQQIHHANLDRADARNLKVGGHQASCASVVTMMTVLFFRFMERGDLISIKPHASPVFHAIQYLLGNLDASYLKRLRAYGGLQAYPSRTKDPDDVHFSTGSVGLGAVAPNFAALVYHYLRTHEFGASSDQRFISLVGDAELDEGSVWEAIAEPAMAGINNVLWVVDLNRQSLDRIIPGIRVRCWREMFAANGWHVIDAKYGKRLQDAFEQPNGELLRICLDELSNEAYQRLLRLAVPELRQWLPKKSRYPEDLRRLLNHWDDKQLRDLFWNLGGHDLEEMEAALRKATHKGGPSVVFAYSLKGWRLPSVGHPHNHSVLLTSEQMESLRLNLGIEEDEVWSTFSPDSEEARLCQRVSERLAGPKSNATSTTSAYDIPDDLRTSYGDFRSTQQTFGVILTKLSRACPQLVKHIVTVSPDVASSTNLGGWINKHGVWRMNDSEVLPPDQESGLLKWSEASRGQHIELGISENNLFLILGQLGLAQELFGTSLIPLGTLYDPFVRRGLDAFFYSIYCGAKMIVVGTPSGVTLAREGGAHQSLLTPSIGVELPEVAAYEPCFAQEVEWILLNSLRRVLLRESSTYLRLTTKRMDQSLFPDFDDGDARERCRRQVVRGAYRLRDCSHLPGYAPGENVVHLFACGAMVPEAVAAHELLKERDVFANVINVTGPGPLYSAFQNHVHETVRGLVPEHDVFDEIIMPDERRAPAVTVCDAHPHSLAWIGSALGTKLIPLGTTGFGQSGDLQDVYRVFEIDAASIQAACVAALQ